MDSLNGTINGWSIGANGDEVSGANGGLDEIIYRSLSCESRVSPRQMVAPIAIGADGCGANGSVPLVPLMTMVPIITIIVTIVGAIAAICTIVAIGIPNDPFPLRSVGGYRDKGIGRVVP